MLLLTERHALALLDVRVVLIAAPLKLLTLTHNRRSLLADNPLEDVVAVERFVSHLTDDLGNLLAILGVGCLRLPLTDPQKARDTARLLLVRRLLLKELGKCVLDHHAGFLANLRLQLRD